MGTMPRKEALCIGQQCSSIEAQAWVRAVIAAAIAVIDGTCSSKFACFMPTTLWVYLMLFLFCFFAFRYTQRRN